MSEPPIFGIRASAVVRIGCDDGDNIVERFRAFYRNEGIHPVPGWQPPFGDGLREVFCAEDATVLRAWLEGNGAKDIE